MCGTGAARAEGGPWVGRLEGRGTEVRRTRETGSLARSAGLPGTPGPARRRRSAPPRWAGRPYWRGFEALLPQRRLEMLDVVGPARLERQLDVDPGQPRSEKVRSWWTSITLADWPPTSASRAASAPGSSGSAPEPHQPAVLDQPALDDARQDVDVDVAARDDDAPPACREPLARFRCTAPRRHRPGALGHGLFPLEQQEHGVRDLLLVDRHDVVDVRLTTGSVRSPGAHRDAVGDGGARRRRHRLPAARRASSTGTPRSARRSPGCAGSAP